MRLREEQIARLAEQVLISLDHDGLITLKVERGKVLAAIKNAVAADIRQEADLEKDAERLLEQTLRSMGGGGDIDKPKMLRMVKEKLAKERKIVL
jgi:hypothetical protein